MKNKILFSLLLMSLQLSAQNFLSNKSTTRAVVVGISNYEDENISKLKYAHKDAIEFSRYLQTPAGGSVDSNDIKLLIDENATSGDVYKALFWLKRASHPGDRAIIYFSGHGDVESNVPDVPGFLLCWNSPPEVYMAGGTIEIGMLKKIVSNISVDSAAQVILVIDACRSGNLAGSTNGSQITGANLAEKVANEILILSCQPDELSYEGEQWGGGRGAFSYHLINGLYGKADEDDDLKINLDEIATYLKNNVRREVAPNSQWPNVVGDPRENLAFVDSDFLALADVGNNNPIQISENGSKGFEENFIETLDAEIKSKYDAFLNALEEQRFLLPKEDCADFYFEELMKETKLEKLFSSLRRHYAFKLQDGAQTVLNKWLKTDISEILLSQTSQKLKYQNYPLYLERAATLLGEDHYMYPVFQARKNYFEGRLLALSSEKSDKKIDQGILDKFKEALKYQSHQPHVNLSISTTFGYNLLQPDSAEHYARLASADAPTWLLPYTYTAYMFSDKYKDFEKAASYLREANQIDSTDILVLNGWGNYHFHKKEYDKAELYYQRCLTLDSTFFYTYNNLGSVNAKAKNFSEAERFYKKVIQIDSTFVDAYINLGIIYGDMRDFKKAESSYKKALQFNPKSAHAFRGLGAVYINTKRYDEGGSNLLKSIEIDSGFAGAYHNLGVLYMRTEFYSDGKDQLLKAVELDSTRRNSYYNLGTVCNTLEQYDEAVSYFEKALAMRPSFNTYLNLGNTYFFQKEYEKAEENYSKAAQLKPENVNAIYNIGFVQNLRNNYTDAELNMQKVIELDSNHIMAYYTLGGIYSNTQKYEKAEKYYQTCIRLDSDYMVDAHLGLLESYYKTQRFDEAELYFNKIVEIIPDDPKPYYHMARARSLQGKKAKANKWLERALKKGLNNKELILKESDFDNINETAKFQKALDKYFPLTDT